MKITAILGYSTQQNIQNRWNNKIFHDKQKLKQYMTTKPPLQKILQGIHHTENESKQNHERQAVQKHRRRKGKKVKSNTIKIKTMLRFHLTPVRIAIISNTTNNRCW
jgi:hypothetical protein